MLMKRGPESNETTIRRSTAVKLLACFAVIFAISPSPALSAKKNRGADVPDYHQPVVEPALNQTHTKRPKKAKGKVTTQAAADTAPLATQAATLAAVDCAVNPIP